jgi:hypothetical protein
MRPIKTPQIHVTIRLPCALKANRFKKSGDNRKNNTYQITS